MAHQPGLSTAEFLAVRGNPWRQPPSRRMEWAQGLEVPVLQPGESVDTLYWVGCAGAFDPLGQSVARAVIQLLRRAGVEFALLGTAERCSGDPARRIGEGGLFAQCASRNVTSSWPVGPRGSRGNWWRGRQIKRRSGLSPSSGSAVS